MYDGKTQLLIKNPIDRYLINSPMLPDMKKNADGSLTLYIQKDSPGKDKEVELAARAGRPDLPGDAPVLAEDRGAVDPAAGRRDLAAACGEARRLTIDWVEKSDLRCPSPSANSGYAAARLRMIRSLTSHRRWEQRLGYQLYFVCEDGSRLPSADRTPARHAAGGEFVHRRNARVKALASA